MPMKLPPLEREQTNDFTARAVMDAYYGNPMVHMMPVPWSWGGSFNHRREGQVGAMMQDPKPGKALGLLIDAMRQERRTGHQGAEPLTDSHAPHHYRAMSAAYFWAWNRLDKGPKWAELYAWTRAWWAAEMWLCDQLTVPSGPLAGDVVTWGARFRNGNSDERSVCQSLIHGRHVKKGPKYWERAKTAPDTFPCLVVRDLVSDGAFRDLCPTKPVLTVDLTITRHEDGHEVTVQGGSPKDPTRFKVRYSDGRTWWEGGKAPQKGDEPEIGREVERVAVGRAG